MAVLRGKHRVAVRGGPKTMCMVQLWYNCPQMATKAVKAKVEPQEVVRYEEYDKRHGAKYAAAGVADMDEDDGWGV
jgi:hypothetical protein